MLSAEAVGEAGASEALAGLVQLKCDHCGAVKSMSELKRCSRCK
jgi:hypothetical protein